MNKPHIFFDMDGVLADFDHTAEQVLGTNDIYRWEFRYGTDEFWKRLNAVPDFFLQIRPMHDCDMLLQALSAYEWTILTALPRSNGPDVDQQKRAWVSRWIRRNPPVITCLTKDKPKHCIPGSILIDDRAVNKEAWEAAGGRYVIHDNARSTIRELERMGLKL